MPYRLDRASQAVVEVLVTGVSGLAHTVCRDRLLLPFSSLVASSYVSHAAKRTARPADAGGPFVQIGCLLLIWPRISSRTIFRQATSCRRVQWPRRAGRPAGTHPRGGGQDYRDDRARANRYAAVTCCGLQLTIFDGSPFFFP